MAFTYEKEALATSPLFRARYELGDTNPDKALLDDAEINGLITYHGYSAGVAKLADGLAAKYAQEPDEYEDEGGVKVKWSYKVKVWQETAKRLRAEAATVETALAQPYGIGTLVNPCMEGFRSF